MNEAKIKLTLEDKQILDELKKVGSGFDTLTGKVKAVDKPAKDMSQALTSFGAKFLTLEMGKKMATFAINTARGAQEMKGLSDETKSSAKQFTDILDDSARIGKNITLWALNLGGSVGLLGSISALAKETADSWALMMGGDTSNTSANKNANATALRRADLINEIDMLRTASSEMERYKGKNQNFYDVAVKSSEEYKANIRAIATELKYSEDQINSFLKGGRVKDASKVKPKSVVVSKALSDITIDQPTKDYFEEELKAEEDYLQAHKDIQTKKKDYDLYIAQQIASDEAKINKDANDQKLKDEQALFDAKITALKGVQDILRSGNLADKKTRVGLKAALMAEATANVIVGETKAFAQGGPVGALAGLGLALSFLAQIKTIKDQKFAQGGIVNGPSMGDQVPVRANGGEMILTKQQQSNLFSMANGGGGGTFVFSPTIYGSNNQVENERLIRTANRDFARRLQSSRNNPMSRKAQASV